MSPGSASGCFCPGGHLVRLAQVPVAVAGGLVALLLPVVVARIISGIPLAGARYSQELGAYYQGSLLSRIVHVAPRGLWQMLSTALPATLVPYLSPLPSTVTGPTCGRSSPGW